MREGGGEVARFAAGFVCSDELRKRGFRVGDDLFQNAAVDIPAGAEVLDDRPVALQPHMPNLDLAGHRALVQPPVHHEPAADSAPDIHPKHRIEPHARAVQRLAERCDVCIVFHESRELRERREPFRERKIVPARDVMRLHDPPRFPIHRPAVTHADRARLPALDQLWQRPRDLRADAFAPRRAIHREAPPVEDAPGFIADDDL